MKTKVMKRKTRHNDVHSGWVEYKTLVRINPVKVSSRRIKMKGLRKGVRPSFFLPKVRTLGKGITQMDSIRMSYFTNTNLLERSANIHFVQSFDNIINDFQGRVLCVKSRNYFMTSTINYVDDYALELLNYVFGSEEVEDLEFDFLYGGPLEIVYNTLFSWGNINLNIFFKRILSIIIEYVLVFKFFLYIIKLPLFCKATRKDNVFAALFSPVDGVSRRIYFKISRYKAFTKALVVYDLLPDLSQVILFRFVMYMRLNMLRWLSMFMYKCLTGIYALSHFFSMLLFILDIVYMEILKFTYMYYIIEFIYVLFEFIHYLFHCLYLRF